MGLEGAVEMFAAIKYFLIFVFILRAECSRFLDTNATFDEYLQYVTSYINYTTYYTLPENNSDSVTTKDSTVSDYGSFDFIIIGGGSAGSLLAYRLSEICKWNILLLEAGETENSFTDIPIMNAYFRNSDMNWGYYTAPQENCCLGMIDHKCVYPTGKALGGSGVLGDLVYARGNRKDFDNWANLGNPGWSYEDLLPYFKKTEDIDIEEHDAGYHGYHGPLHVNYTHPEALNAHAIFEANRLLGLNILDYNGKQQVGISKIPWTIKNNKRQTGGSAFVLPIMESRSNLNVTLKAFVTKVLIENDTAIGVQFIKDGIIYNVTATKEVLLSAGAVNSPQILMLSGIGPREELKRHNINVVKDLPVGKYLMDNPAYIGLYVRTNQSAPDKTTADYLQDYINGLSPFTKVFNAEHIAFINTKNFGTEPPNIEIITAYPPFSLPSSAKTFYNLNPDNVDAFSNYNVMTDILIYVVVLKPQSRGTVTLKSSNPADFPVIDPRYYTDPNDEDIEIAYEGIQYVLRMVEQAPLRAINATVISTNPGCEHLKGMSKREYWYCAIKHLSSTLYHPEGTTRMGPSPKNSVVDAQLRVHGMKRLRVVDTGAIPEIVAGHPFAAIFAMAEKVSDIIKLEYHVL